MAINDLDIDASHHAGEEPAAGGQGPLFEGLVKRYRAALISFFLRRVGSASEAEDLAHDVFMRVIRRTSQADINNSSAFLFQVAANLLRDRRRRAQIRSAYSESAQLHEPQVEMVTPERVLQSKQALQELVAGLEELGEKTQDIFLLYHVENMKYREIAEFLGISFSSVDKHMTKALAHLSRRLEPFR